jgi:hypothetical protein
MAWKPIITGSRRVSMTADLGRAMAGYVAAYVFALALACAFWFFLGRHWVRAVRGRNVSREQRQLHLAERRYAERIGVADTSEVDQALEAWAAKRGESTG